MIFLDVTQDDIIIRSDNKNIKKEPCFYTRSFFVNCYDQNYICELLSDKLTTIKYFVIAVANI